MNVTQSHYLSIKQSILLSVLFVGVLWCIKSAELLFQLPISQFGVFPLEISALPGIVSAPLVHGSLEHLFNNTLPLLILGTFFLYGYPNSRLRVLCFIWLVSGSLVWLFARPAYHIGASGLTHGIFFFLFVASILRRDKRSVAIMMVAFFMYGSMTMTILPRDPGISFEYHFFGALAGTIAALFWYNVDTKLPEKHYDWQNVDDQDDATIGDQWQSKPDGQSRSSAFENDKEP